jgi:hypothetical protein
MADEKKTVNFFKYVKLTNPGLGIAVLLTNLVFCSCAVYTIVTNGFAGTGIYLLLPGWDTIVLTLLIGDYYRKGRGINLVK